MASDPDDNPFARPSVWPRMPQAPMSIRTLSGVERSEPEPLPAAITPLFVRPMDAPPATGLLSGGGVPGSRPNVVPVSSVAPITLSKPDPPVQVDVETPALLVAPVRTRLPKVRRWRVPAIAAAMVGLAGLAGLAYLLGRGGQETPAPSVAVSPAAAPLTAALPTPVPQVTAATPTVPAQRTVPMAVVARSGTRPAVARPVSSNSPGSAVPESEASIATSEALAGAVVALPTPVPPQIYRPPPAVDPTAPVVTRDPNS